MNSPSKIIQPWEFGVHKQPMSYRLVVTWKLTEPRLGVKNCNIHWICKIWKSQTEGVPTPPQGSSKYLHLSRCHGDAYWEPEGHYHYSKMFRWESEGRYHHRLCTAIVPFWFSLGTSYLLKKYWEHPSGSQLTIYSVNGLLANLPGKVLIDSINCHVAYEKWRHLEQSSFLWKDLGLDSKLTLKEAFWEASLSIEWNHKSYICTLRTYTLSMYLDW